MYGAIPGARSGALSSASTFDLAAQLTSKAEGRWWERRKEPLSAWQALTDKSGTRCIYPIAIAMCPFLTHPKPFLIIPS